MSRKTVLAVLFLAAAVAATLFVDWEPTGESWGYWFFARRFADGFEAVGGGRSPFYVVWLQTFRDFWGYPGGLTAEYIVSAGLAAGALAWLLAPALGTAWACAVSAGFLPYLQTAEPPVQRLAVAVSCAAVAMRRLPWGRPVGYALLLAAAMLRGPYMLLLAVFLVYDFWKARQGPLAPCRSVLLWLPLAALIGLMGAFAAKPSPHRWSNAWLASTDWIPLKGKSLTETALLGHLAWTHIEKKYGTPRDVDIYFTHAEVFGEGAETLGKAFAANPKAIVDHILRNIKALAGAALSIGSPPASLQRRSWPWLIVALLLIGAWLAAADDEDLRVLILASIAMACSIVLAKSKGRYFPPLVPVFGLGAVWLGGRVRWLLNDAFGARLGWGAAGRLAGAAVVFGLCGGLAWVNLARGIAADARAGDLRVLTYRENSFKKAGPALMEAARGCRGIMSLEHNWFAAFLPYPAPQVYDVWEVPPFGAPGDGKYEGLTPDRVDCLFIAPGLTEGLGWGTNQGLRWRLHIEPYERKLMSLGAERRDIPGYGRAVLLRR